MSTKIKDPSANTPVSGRSTGTLSGAAQGAAAGTAVMPGVGTVVGAVVGGIAGFLGGSAQDKAARQATLAYKYAKIRQERQAAVARRDIIRQFRMQRASAMTMIGNEQGGTRSSAPQGAIASFGAQYGFNASFFDADAYLQSKYQTHANKAGKHAASANMINATLSSVASSVASMGKAFNSPSAPISGGTTVTSGPAPGGILTSPTSTQSTPYAPNWGGPRNA